MTEHTKSETNVLDSLWEKVNERLSGTSDTVQKIKFGRGAVGKTSVIAVAAVIAIAGMAIKIGASAVYVGIIAVTLITLGSFGLIFYIVCKRPELAVMEGAELVMYQHVQMASKNYVPSPSEALVQRPLDGARPIDVTVTIPQINSEDVANG